MASIIHGKHQSHGRSHSCVGVQYLSNLAIFILHKVALCLNLMNGNSISSSTFQRKCEDVGICDSDKAA
jgi:hypothetical protein